MSINVIQYLKSIDWKAFLKGPTFIVIVGAICFLGGRFSSPEKTKVVTVDKVVETHHEQTQVVQQVDIDKLLQKVEEKTRIVNRDVVRVVTIKPDGTRIETETDKSKIDSTQHTDTNNSTNVAKTIDTKNTIDDSKSEERTKTVVTDSSKNWRVGILGGYSHNSSGLLTGVPGLIIGGYAERKVLGPINAGVWMNTQPGIGLQLSVSF